jgi:hypothetical protein
MPTPASQSCYELLDETIRAEALAAVLRDKKQR